MAVPPAKCKHRPMSFHAPLNPVAMFHYGRFFMAMDWSRGVPSEASFLQTDRKKRFIFATGRNADSCPLHSPSRHPPLRLFLSSPFRFSQHCSPRISDERL